MVKTRHLLYTFLICATLFSRAAAAQSTLTEIRDTVTTPGGSLFNGTVSMTWNGFAGPNGNTQSPLSTSARIYNGVLSVLLVPTTTAAASAYYQVIYTSTDGTLTWSEIWQVPPSPIPLTISAVRSSSGGGSGGSGSGSGGSGSGSGQYATLPISISEITGLSADLSNLSNNISGVSSQLNALIPTVTNDDTLLASLTATVANLSAAISALQSSGTGSAAVSVNGAYIDAETPAGTIDGNNATFTLSQVPTPAASLALYRNGLVQTVGVDFALSGSTITFLSEAVPQAADVLTAYYRTLGQPQTVNFADSEIPAGTIDGNNTSFTLLHSPNPAQSLKLYKNGVLLRQNGDYTISGSNITFISVPQPGDSLLANYRY